MTNSTSTEPTGPRVIIDEENPWPDLDAYYEDAADFFNGRERESEALLGRVKQASLTVLFGKSGLGKTSLLKAGLFPLLRREHILPVYIRLDVQDRSTPLIDQVASAYKAELQAFRVDAPDFLSGETLWEYFHRQDLELWSADNWRLTPLLVFDQMEEIFTLGSDNPEAIQQLRVDLSDLVENRIPVPLARRIEAGAPIDPFALDSRQARYLFSFREDFLPDFEGWRQDIPSLMRNRLRITAMTEEQAFKAVYKTGSKIVDEAMAVEVVRFITGEEAAPDVEKAATVPKVIHTAARKIEPALLSVVCSGLNERRKKQGKRKSTGTF
jgi:hypothetical protein